MTDLNERDTRLVQWLTEAYAKESELEADLRAHISLTEKASYRKRLEDHLRETREHRRRVGERIEQLGGSVGAGLPVPLIGRLVGAVAGRAVALAKGQLGTARGIVTEQSETHLRNAQEELREEHVEIALYTRIEVFAEEVGDRRTATLAASIRREEERMAAFLSDEIPRLVKAIVARDIPRAQRTNTARSGGGSRGTSSARNGSRSTAARNGSTSRGTAGSAGGSGGTSARARSAAARAKATHAPTPSQ